MDGTAFDLLARRLATQRSRRTLLGGLAVAFAGERLRRAAMASAQTADSSGVAVCAEDADCSADSPDPCTGATCVDGACTYFIAACAPGYTCCGNGSCCPDGGPTVCASDADCVVPDDPCAGGSCDNGTCVTFLVLCVEGTTCCGNGACCPVTDACRDDGDCPSYPNPCLRGRCLSGTCVPTFVTCPPGETCRDGACLPFGA